jgi:predicted amidophosphoribosyltransferase
MSVSDLHARRADWIANGRCADCGKPAHSGLLLCTVCRAKHNEIARRSWRKKQLAPVKAKHCSRCGVAGHDVRTCPGGAA